MAYKKEKDAIFAKQVTTGFEPYEKQGYNFLRENKFGRNVFSKKGQLFVSVGFHENLIPEKMWRYYFKKKI